MNDITTILNRAEHEFDLDTLIFKLQSKRILITGAGGAIGRPMVNFLRQVGVRVVPTDLHLTASDPYGMTTCDITDFGDVLRTVAFYDPTCIINLAAQKHAPLGESDPWGTIKLSVGGVKNLLDTGRPIIQVSTCKACDPEVSYGAGKLCGEKLALQWGSSVVRLFNVANAYGGNVFDLWSQIPEDEPIPAASYCRRYFISIKEAISSILWAAVLEPGRYAPNPGSAQYMHKLAARLYPDRVILDAPARRGDRRVEPLHAGCEGRYPTEVPNLLQIVSAHDAQMPLEALVSPQEAQRLMAGLHLSC